MKELEKVATSKNVVKSITCDVCNEKYTDDLELQEFIHIEHDGGYGSVFGDETEIRCDICQKCLKEKLGKFLIVKEYGINC